MKLPMKNYYILALALAFISAAKLSAQVLPNEGGPPERPVIRSGRSVAPFVGISVSIPLWKVLGRRKPKALPEAPTADYLETGVLVGGLPTPPDKQAVAGTGTGAGVGEDSGTNDMGAVWDPICGCYVLPPVDLPPPGGYTPPTIDPAPIAPIPGYPPGGIGGGGGNSNIPTPGNMYPKNKGCEVYKEMWARSVSQGKEQFAMLTDQGIIFCPDGQNTMNTSYSVYNLTPLPDGREQVTFNGQHYILIATIHTHPVGSQWGDGPSTPDFQASQLWGVPGFVMADEGIVKYDGRNGRRDASVLFPRQDIFNCYTGHNLYSSL